jgi:hypothetical protein
MSLGVVARGAAHPPAGPVRRTGRCSACPERTPLITLDDDDLYCVLDQCARLDDVLKRKNQRTSETGSCYFPVREMIAEQ